MKLSQKSAAFRTQGSARHRGLPAKAGRLFRSSLSAQPLPSLPYGRSVQWPPAALLHSLAQVAFKNLFVIFNALRRYDFLAEGGTSFKSL